MKYKNINRFKNLILAAAIIAAAILAVSSTGLVSLNCGQNTNPSPPAMDMQQAEISSDELPRHLKEAVIAVEDRRFYEHNGFDYIRMIRAFFTNLRAGRIVEGGSTISQQYVKNAYLYPDRTLNRKIKEAYLTIELEKNHSKDEILAMYLDRIYFGSGSFGIEEASRLYFDTEPSQLDLSQSALLAGVIRAPEVYSPLNNLELSINRRNRVLEMMFEQNLIDKKEYIEALSSEVELNI